VTQAIAPTGAAAAPQASQQQALKEAAQAFEAIFLRQMLGAMRAGSVGEDIFGSSATEQFRELADARTAESMSKTGAFGIAELLLSQFNAKPAAAQPAEKPK
jgi:flagellar protein FlgJ